MLPLPNLDDRTFKQIVEDSKRLIHQYFPEWTDENYHDPGITLTELLAWLTEMQGYYLDQITDRNRLKFLKLLGVEPRDSACARVDVSFSGVGREFLLPSGTRVSAANQVFETEEAILLLPAQIDRILVLSDGRYQDSTSFNESRGLSYLAFGREARKQNRLYIGFDQKLPAGRETAITINLFDDYPAPRVEVEAGSADFLPSARVSWQYYGAAPGRETAEWLPLEVRRDETVHLSQSGRVVFVIPGQMKPSKMPLAADRARFWISCVLEEEGYEVPPRIERVALNTTAAVQRQTISQSESFSGSGNPRQTFTVSNYLSYHGIIQVQVMDEDGNWRYCRLVDEITDAAPGELCCSIARDDELKTTTIFFGDEEHGFIPPDGSDNVRVISYRHSFQERRLIGRSTGLPHQRFRPGFNRIIRPGFLLQVGKWVKTTGEFVWQDWTMVRDFDTSGADDKHFRWDEETGEIVFGDNEHGLAPDRAEFDNIAIIALQTGGGVRGNVREGEVNELVDQVLEIPGLQVSNYHPARGGEEREEFGQAVHRMRRGLKEPTRAVTSEDYERIVRATPGLRVARVKALPLYVKGLADYPKNQAPAQVTVVVAPYSEDKKPTPSAGFLETVRRQLDKCRLITTEVHVVPAEYIKVMVYAVVVVSPDLLLDSAVIAAGLDRFLKPLDDEQGPGWAFGRTVYKGDIYGVISRIEGVEYIQDLSLNAEGPGVQKDASGDIRIPPHALPYLGGYEIQVVKTTDL